MRDPLYYVVVTFYHERPPKPGEEVPQERYGEVKNRVVAQDLLGPFGSKEEANAGALAYERETNISRRFYRRAAGYNYLFAFIEAELPITTRPETFEEWLDRHDLTKTCTGDTWNPERWKALGEQFKNDAGKLQVPTLRLVEVPKVETWRTERILISFENYPPETPGRVLAWDANDHWVRILQEAPADDPHGRRYLETQHLKTNELKPGMRLHSPRQFGDPVVVKTVGGTYWPTWTETVAGLLPERPDLDKLEREQPL